MTSDTPDVGEDPPRPGYNERLFCGDPARAHYHLARFKWVAGHFDHLPPNRSVIELGCFDGKLLDFIGRRAREYVGLDANWEGGLDRARKKFAGRPNIRFIEAEGPEKLHEFSDGQFDVAVSLETLEHLPPSFVDPYLAELARVTKGHLFVSVPNEMGPIFAAKYIVKKLVYGDAEAYSFREFVAASFRRSEKVGRNEHKGFDYRSLVGQIGKYFEVTAVEGVAGFGLPPSLSPTVGIMAVKNC